MNGRKPGSVCTATCCVCGAKEQAKGAGGTFRCVDCRDKFAAEIRALSDCGYSQVQIAARLSMSQNRVSAWCQAYGIVTRFKKPQHDKIARAVGIGQEPAKLMPSARALGLVNVFSLGV